MFDCAPLVRSRFASKFVKCDVVIESSNVTVSALILLKSCVRFTLVIQKLNFCYQISLMRYLINNVEPLVCSNYIWSVVEHKGQKTDLFVATLLKC